MKIPHTCLILWIAIIGSALAQTPNDPATFSIATKPFGDVIKMVGYIDSNTQARFETIAEANPSVKTLWIEDCDGSADDEANVILCRHVYSNGFNTYMESGDQAHSGGVDLFVSGNQRYAHQAAILGVHSWSDGQGLNAANLPRNHPDHQRYITLYTDMWMTQQQAEDFYFYTINAAPPETMHNMTAGERTTYLINTTTTWPPAPTITWSNPAAITFGTTLGAVQLNASSSVAGTFSYLPTTGATLGAGQHTLTTTFTPTNSAFASATKTVTLTVNKATPTIAWSDPAAITYGTALGATQLNASSTAPGTITYSPASGVLNAGAHPLNANLAESDNFVAASKQVNLTVNPAALTVTADNQQRDAGLANPTLTASYSGLVNGDTAPATLPSLSTTAVIDSEPGIYPITVSGGSDPNYTVTRVNGTLTVVSNQVPEIVLSDFQLDVMADSVKCSFTWESLANAEYKIQFSRDLRSWTDTPGGITGTGSAISKEVTIPIAESVDRMFFRLRANL